MTPVYIITVILVSVAVSSAAPSFRNNETFVDCVSKCLIGGDEQEHVAAVFKICKDSPTCWGDHLGGRVLRCASECKAPAPDEVLVWTALESSSLAESDVPDWVKCVANCLGVSVAQLEEWYKECKTSKSCWFKKVGFRGATCFRKCHKGYETIPVLFPDALESSSLAESDVPDWVKCVAKCLGVSVAQLEEWYKECKTSKSCWFKKVGFRGVTCFRKCHKGDETIPVLFPDALESSSLAESDVPDWVKCVANCLGVSVAQLEEWYKECKTSKSCWFKKVGFRGVTCFRKCHKGDETIPVLFPDALEFSSLAESDVPDWVKCVANCLGVSVAQLEEWYKECKTSKSCWFKKVGFRGVTCFRKCHKGDETIPVLFPDVPIPSQSDRVKFASYEKFIEIKNGSKGTSPSMEMEINGLD